MHDLCHPRCRPHDQPHGQPDDQSDDQPQLIRSMMPLHFISTLAGTTLLEAVRNRLFWLAAIVVGVALGLTQFLNQVAITESLEIQVALLAALLRVAAVFIVATFIITSMAVSYTHLRAHET